ncbi:unnamed protein product [Calypogeia fissa]
MALAAVVESSPKITARSYYQAFWKAIPFMAVKNETPATRDSTAIVIEEDKSRADPLGVTESKEEKTEEQTTHHGDKAKKKFGKKKEIVSSSTVVPRLEVCVGKKCKARGSEALLGEFQTASNGRVEIAYTKCMHECKQGMNARVTKDGTTFEWHHAVTTTDVAPILCKHFDW